MRGKQATKRKLIPDARYNSATVTKFINYIMLDGKKEVARKIVYRAIEELGKRTKASPVVALEKAFETVKPRVEVRSRRVGGANYQVPMPVGEGRQMALAMRWIIAAFRSNRGKKESWEVLFEELYAATKKEGAAYKKMEDSLKMAEANKAFSHLSW